MKQIESKCRNRTVEENLRVWEEMKKGSEEGLAVAMRLKIDMKVCGRRGWAGYCTHGQGLVVTRGVWGWHDVCCAPWGMSSSGRVGRHAVHHARCPPCTLAKASTEDSLALPSCSRAGAATGGAEPMELIFLPGTALCLAWVSAMKSI